MIFVVVLCDAFTVFAALRLSQCHAPHRALSPPRTHTTYAEHTLDTGSTATDRQRHHVMEAELDVLQMTGIRMLHRFNKQLLTSCVACSYFCLHVCLFFFVCTSFSNTFSHTFVCRFLSILSLNIVLSARRLSSPPPTVPLPPPRRAARAASCPQVLRPRATARRRADCGGRSRLALGIARAGAARHDAGMEAQSTGGVESRSRGRSGSRGERSSRGRHARHCGARTGALTWLGSGRQRSGAQVRRAADANASLLGAPSLHCRSECAAPRLVARAQ